MLYKYFSFPLKSNVELPELSRLTDSALAKVSFWLQKERVEILTDMDWIYQWKTDDGFVTISAAKSDDEYTLQFPGLARFVICRKTLDIRCLPQEGVPVQTIRHLLLDQVLPRLYHHFFVEIILHGSFVQVAGKGIVFAGETGWGKSSLAAAFTQVKGSVMTDDCLMLKKIGEKVFGIPSYTSIRLYEDSLSLLPASVVSDSFRMSHYSPKVRVGLHASGKNKIEIDAVIFLNDPNEYENKRDISLLPMGNLEAVKQLIRNSFSLDVTDRQVQENELKLLGGIIDSGITFWSFEFPREYTRLPDVVKEVLIFVC